MPLVVLAGALAGAHGQAYAAGETLCNYQSATFAKLDSAKFAGCVKLRTKGTAAATSPTVWSLSDESVFPTTCPVQIGLLPEHPTDCSQTIAAQALKTGDLVRVDEWGAGKLELIILRDGVSVMHADRPRVFLNPATVTLEDGVHTIGYFADAQVYATPARTGKPVDVSYYVYLADTVQNDIPVRWYLIEVFDSSPKCRAEIPGHADAATTRASCGVAAQKLRVRLRDQVGPLQAPMGGGGEPPPTPPG